MSIEPNSSRYNFTSELPSTPGVSIEQRHSLIALRKLAQRDLSNMDFEAAKITVRRYLSKLQKECPSFPLLKKEATLHLTTLIENLPPYGAGEVIDTLKPGFVQDIGTCIVEDEFQKQQASEWADQKEVLRMRLKAHTTKSTYNILWYSKDPYKIRNLLIYVEVLIETRRGKPGEVLKETLTLVGTDPFMPVEDINALRHYFKISLDRKDLSTASIILKHLEPVKKEPFFLNYVRSLIVAIKETNSIDPYILYQFYTQFRNYLMPEKGLIKTPKKIVAASELLITYYHKAYIQQERLQIAQVLMSQVVLSAFRCQPIQSQILIKIAQVLFPNFPRCSACITNWLYSPTPRSYPKKLEEVILNILNI